MPEMGVLTKCSVQFGTLGPGVRVVPHGPAESSKCTTTAVRSIWMGWATAAVLVSSLSVQWPPARGLLHAAPLAIPGQQLPWRGGDAFDARRTVRLEAGTSLPAVVVSEFSTHGELLPDGANLAVFDQDGPVPWRILQIGPGDICRLALQTTPRQ